MSMTGDMADEFDVRVGDDAAEQDRPFRVLTDDARAVLDKDIWDHYSTQGAIAIAKKHEVAHHYVLGRAGKIGAQASGEHLLTPDDFRLIEGLLREGLSCEEISGKFDIKATLVLRIKHNAKITTRAIARSMRK